MNTLVDAAGYAETIYRKVTSPIRLLPDFIIIGTQKGGTTSLYNYLIEHPNIVSASSKEIHFFDFNFKKGLLWYKTQFPTTIYKYYTEHIRKQDFITGEASPYYLFHPHSPKRVAETLPHVKLIAILRNPVDRLYSQYRHKVSHGHEPLSLEEAIACDEERTSEEEKKVLANGNYYSYNHNNYCYLTRGIYVDQLQRWLRFFPREQLLVLKSEDLYADPAAIYKQTLAFLNAPIMDLQEGYKQHNKSKDTPSTSKMDPELRQRLVAYYEPHNARLYELLGKDFGW